MTDVPQPNSASLNETEKLGAAGATHKRITLADLRAAIESVYYLIPGVELSLEPEHPLCRTTLCFITTWSGFSITGKSTPISPENFDAEKGRTFAYEDAMRQLWPLMAFADLERRGSSL